MLHLDVMDKKWLSWHAQSSHSRLWDSIIHIGVSIQTTGTIQSNCFDDDAQ